jgi:hypothetical protein
VPISSREQILRTRLAGPLELDFRVFQIPGEKRKVFLDQLPATTSGTFARSLLLIGSIPRSTINSEVACFGEMLGDAKGAGQCRTSKYITVRQDKPGASSG